MITKYISRVSNDPNTTPDLFAMAYVASSAEGLESIKQNFSMFLADYENLSKLSANETETRWQNSISERAVRDEYHLIRRKKPLNA